MPGKIIFKPVVFLLGQDNNSSLEVEIPPEGELQAVSLRGDQDVVNGAAAPTMVRGVLTMIGTDIDILLFNGMLSNQSTAKTPLSWFGNIDLEVEQRQVIRLIYFNQAFTALRGKLSIRIGNIKRGQIE